MRKGNRVLGESDQLELNDASEATGEPLPATDGAATSKNGVAASPEAGIGPASQGTKEPVPSYEAHPLLEALIPRMTAQEQEGLANSMRAAGQPIGPIVLFEGKILDGRERYEIVQKQGLRAEFVEWN